MAKKSDAVIGFEKQIWKAACVLWGSISASDYRKVFIGLIFLRYISASFEKRYQELVAEGQHYDNNRDAYMEKNTFYVPESVRWGVIAAVCHTDEIHAENLSKSKDLLGRTYEYCIAKFAEQEGEKGGEFYAPVSIVRTIVGVLHPLGNFASTKGRRKV